MKSTFPLLQQLRQDTPGCTHRIHLNNAGASLVPRVVSDAIADYLQLESMEGGYESAVLKAREIEESYQILANLLNTEAKNVAFTSSATDSYSRALSSIPFKEGDVILTTQDDYASNQISFLSLQQRMGVRILHAPNNPYGEVSVDALKKLIREYRPKLVSVTHIPTNSGLIQPVEAIGEICQQADVLYLVDACQSAGQLPLDVQNIQCDFLSATSRKFLRGPRGMGFLYVSDKVLDFNLAPLFLDLHAASWKAKDQYVLESGARRFEDFETSYALLLGFKEAMKYGLGISQEAISKRIQELASYTRKQLQVLPHVEVLDRGKRKGGIVSAYIPGIDPQQLMKHLAENKVNAGVAYPYNALIDFGVKNIPWSLRFSPHVYNTYEEIDQCVALISTFLKRR